MGVRKICDDGFVMAQCRCMRKHTITVVPCDGVHRHGLEARPDDLIRAGLGHLVATGRCHPSWCFVCKNTGSVAAGIANYTTSCTCTCHAKKGQ